MSASELSKLISKMDYWFVLPIEAFILFMDRTIIIALHNNYGDCLQHTEALSSARIPASAVRPAVVLKGLPNITTHLKGKWHVFKLSNNIKFSDSMCFLKLLISILSSIVLKRHPLYVFYIYANFWSTPCCLWSVDVKKVGPIERDLVEINLAKRDVIPDW